MPRTHEGIDMNNEDEILKKLMTNDGRNYIADDGFTGRVMNALPEPRRAGLMLQRRTWILAAGTLAGCIAFAATAGSSWGEFADALSKAIANASVWDDAFTLGAVVVGELAAAAGIVYYCIAGAKSGD
jgi:hypothetical protein